MSDTSFKRTVAFARFPGLIRDAVRGFERLTGLPAVTTLGAASSNLQAGGLMSPPVHPLCAKSLRQTSRESTCEAEWQKHLRFAEQKQARRMHLCPLGLRCACVPIVLGGELLGLAKFVSGPEMSKERFSTHVGLLEVLISRPCQELHILVLQEEIQALRVSVDSLRRTKRPAFPNRDRTDVPVSNEKTSVIAPTAGTLVSDVLTYLNEHYAEKDLSLLQVAVAIGKNEKYVTHLFATQVGERMRTYITGLRVRHACELLLQTNLTIEQIACDSGFAHTAQFRQSFRRIIGVTASEYRQIFATGI